MSSTKRTFYYLPTRKCTNLIKFVLIISFVLMYKFCLYKTEWGEAEDVTEAETVDYEKKILQEEANIVPGLGEGGELILMDSRELEEARLSKLVHGINVWTSEQIAYNRTLKDYRDPFCKDEEYPLGLPSASVIMTFHNEPYSTLIRSLWSVINSVRRSQPWYQQTKYKDETEKHAGYPGQDPNSPFVYLKEIILVDDGSTSQELKGKLDYYVRTRLPPDLIRIIRLPSRAGVVGARLGGARAARGAVLVMLDAHVEVQRDWLRPLLTALRNKPSCVVMPIIDFIDNTKFKYYDTKLELGGFSFMGHYKSFKVTATRRHVAQLHSDVVTVVTPTMTGGLFAIDRSYFWELGAYDDQMKDWGGVNLEMSFRIWQCGGSLEIVPCSRVGHVFRYVHPYKSHGTHTNTIRIAETWMDDYAEILYFHFPELREKMKYLNIIERKKVREKLKCKSFKWYLDNVYPEKFVPVQNVHGFGKLRNNATKMCLDTLREETFTLPLGLDQCNNKTKNEQFFSLTKLGILRNEDGCAIIQPLKELSIWDSITPGQEHVTMQISSRPVLLAPCEDISQKWRRLPGGQLQHVDSNLCLTAAYTPRYITSNQCNFSDPLQVWEFEYSAENHFSKNSTDPDELHKERRLRNLRELENQRNFDSTRYHKIKTSMTFKLN